MSGRRTYIETYGKAYDVNKESKVRGDDGRLARIRSLQGPVQSVLFIALWYLFSISISVYNKWMFSEGHLNFRFPIFTTCGHQVVQGALAYFTIARLSDQLGLKNRLDTLFTEINYLKSVGPCALASAGDIGMGNLSIRMVTLSFYTMVKSSSLVFVLLFSILFGLEKPQKSLITVVLSMTFGVILMVAGETQFQAVGFILILISACFSGLRWSLTRLLLKPKTDVRLPINEKNLEVPEVPHKHNPVETILLLSPLMSSTLFVLALLMEGLQPFLSAELWSYYGVIPGLLMIAFPGVLAFCMTIAEFLLLASTSVLTLSIAGVFKEIITISIGLIFFNETLSFVNSLGLVITLTTMVLYNIIKYREASNGSI